MHHPTKAHPKRVSVSISISGALFVCLLLHTITLCTARRGLTPTKMNAALTVSSSALSRSLAQSAPAASLNQGFVTVQNTTFSLNDRPWFCAGSNAFYAAIVDRLTEDQVWELFKVHASQNATVVRVFAHSDGYGLPGQMSVSHPIQPQLGQYDETALQRLDLVLQAAGANGIRLILPLTNFEPFLGGMQWYAEQVYGAGADKELFYTSPTIRASYMAYVKAIILRTNTLTGLAYKDDPTILAFELMNEPHTRDNYERDHGVVPGTMVRAWIKDMAAYIKSLDTNHLLFTGEEGYRTNGPELEAQHAWINNGLKGVDFASNCADPNIDACGVHAYPDNWGFAPSEYEKYGPMFLQDRAAVAHALGKPIIMEEYGMMAGYLSSRDELLGYLQGQADAAGYACSLVWAVDPGGMDSGVYVFGYDGDGASALKQQYAFMKSKSG